MAVRPYKTTPVWDEQSLPAAIRNRHSTKTGVWGVLRVLQGEVRLIFEDGPTLQVTAESPALIRPQHVHHVETSAPFLMQVEFYHEKPDIG